MVELSVHMKYGSNPDLDLMVNSPDVRVRLKVAEVGYGLDVLYKDPSEQVRAVVAEKGYKLNVLAQDESKYVREEVAKQGSSLELLSKDADEMVRGAVAYNYDKCLAMVDDHSGYVRRQIAKAGFGLDKLINDTALSVKATVEVYLNNRGITIDQWINENPDKCALPENQKEKSVNSISQNQSNFNQYQGKYLLVDGENPYSTPAFVQAEYIKIKKDSKFIRKGAFQSCENLKEVVIPSSVSTIYEKAFAYCENLEKVTLPDHLEEIYSSAFEGCTSLKTIELPKSLCFLGAHAFMFCKNLNQIYINSWPKLGYGVFFGCDSVKEVVLPKKFQKHLLNNNLYNNIFGSFFNPNVLFAKVETKSDVSQVKPKNHDGDVR